MLLKNFPGSNSHWIKWDLLQTDLLRTGHVVFGIITLQKAGIKLPILMFPLHINPPVLHPKSPGIP